MQHLLEAQSKSQQPHWLDYIEALSVIGSVGGAIVSAVTQQVAFASIPLSLTATLHFANRRRLHAATSQVRQMTIEKLTQQGEENQKHIAVLAQQAQAHQKFLQALNEKLESVAQQGTELSQQAQALGEKDQQIAAALQQLKEIDQLTQFIVITPQNAELYYLRGLARGGLESSADLRLAIQDYTQAIELEAAYADAYFQRGALKGKVGEKKQAVADLRVAAKLYFDAGDLEHYDQATILSQAQHEFVVSNTSSDPETDNSEPSSIEGLFG